jgi:hypothetical protein
VRGERGRTPIRVALLRGGEDLAVLGLGCAQAVR